MRVSPSGRALPRMTSGSGWCPSVLRFSCASLVLGAFVAFAGPPYLLTVATTLSLGDRGPLLTDPQKDPAP